MELIGTRIKPRFMVYWIILIESYVPKVKTINETFNPDAHA